MQKLPTRGELARYNGLRQVQPGYPAQPFTSPEDIEAYLRDDRIDCLMCGRRFKTLLIHVSKIHEMDEGEYRTRFNIPASYVLAGQATVAKLQANYKALDDDHAIKQNAARSVKPQPRSKEKRRALVPMVADSWKVGINRMNADPNKPRMASRIKAPRRNEPAMEWAPDEHDWHLAQARLHEEYRDMAPPAGKVSWSGFKKRRNADPELNRVFHEARALGKSDRKAAREAARAERAERNRIRMAQPRPHLRTHDISVVDTLLERIASGRTTNEVLADADMPSRTWFNQRMAEDPELQRRHRETIDALPFTLQSRMQMLGERFVEAVRGLRSRDGVTLSDRRIADALGVTAMTVNNVRRRHGIA